MARQDIFVDAVYGEVETTTNLTNKPIYDFKLINYLPGMDNDNYIYGEIIVPANFESRYKEETGIRTHIPYQPIYKELQIRFLIDNGTGFQEYVINRNTNKTWFPVVHIRGNERNKIRLSGFRTINENNNYNLIIRDGFLELFSADETDFTIKTSLQQNQVFLLKAMAGNLYQYPQTGVGLIEFLHGNFENSGLAQKLQSEFESDNMIINNAFMDSQTGELLLDVSERDG